MRPTKKRIHAGIGALVFILALLLGSAAAIAAPTLSTSVNSSGLRVTGLSAPSGPVRGGNRLIVTGKALKGVTRVKVGDADVPKSDWKINSSTKLTILSVPAAHGAGPVEVTLFDSWGASPATVKDLYWYGSSTASTSGEKVVREAVKYLGKPYLWGGTSPTTGFDCSGFTRYVYSKFGISLPHRAAYQATCGSPVAKKDLRPGDLVFFYSPVRHVGMYVGGGMMINSPGIGDLVCIEDAYRSSYVTARRMIPLRSRYEQSDPHLVYKGSWSTPTVGSASGGSFQYANTAGASVTASFNGTYLAWIAKRSPVYGLARVTLDNKTPVVVNLHNSSTLYQQRVWNSGTLARGTHTVKIEWIGAKGVAAKGTNINVDAFEVLGSLTKVASSPVPVSAANSYERTDPRLTYAGTWKTVSDSAATGGSFAYADSAGASLTIRFIGTHLAWIAKQSPAYGQAKVTVDGGAAHIVDLYNSKTVWKHTVWQTGTLKNGAHTVVISWTGKKRTAATGTNIDVDAIKVTGVLTGRYQQSNAKLSYAGTWNTSSSSSASSGSFKYASTSGASVMIHFTGINLAWIAKTGPAYGEAKVTVDGTKTYTVNLYSAKTAWQKRVWSTGILAMGAHTVEIRWTGAKSKAATGTNIGVDAIDVTGALN